MVGVFFLSFLSSLSRLGGYMVSAGDTEKLNFMYKTYTDLPKHHG